MGPADAWPNELRRFRQLARPVLQGGGPIPRIAVIIPIAYKGGTLRGFTQICRMIRRGAEERGDRVEVVAVAPDGAYDDAGDDSLADLRRAGIPVRTFRYQPVSADLRGPIHAGHEAVGLPEDGRKSLLDCDFWLFVSDRVSPVPPPGIRYGSLAFDFLQRSVRMPGNEGLVRYTCERIVPFLRAASVVLCTTPRAAEDARTFIGVHPSRIRVAPPFTDARRLALQVMTARGRRPRRRSFLWATNRSYHKNIPRTLRALRRYYTELHGTIGCTIVGLFEVDEVKAGKWDEFDHLREARELLQSGEAWLSNIETLGYVGDAHYDQLLVEAAGVINPSLFDNGSFAAIDAAYAGVPVAQSFHPCNRHFDRVFGIRGAMFDPYSEASIARALFEVERGTARPSREAPRRVEQHDWRRVAAEFWDQIRTHALHGRHAP